MNSLSKAATYPVGGDQMRAVVLELSGSDLVSCRVEPDAVLHVHLGHQRSLATQHLEEEEKLIWHSLP